MKHFLLALAFAGLLGCGSDRRADAPLQVFAAASTKEALDEAARGFQAETGIAVLCSFAASSTLARQIEEGADADLFLSADQRWADYLADKQLVAQRRDLLGNRLVVITPADSTLMLRRLADLEQPGVGHLALALDSVPAGHYARAALQTAGLWKKVEGRVREAGDVRAALTYVVRGEAEAGFVYATDAATTDKVRVAFTVAEDLHPPIRYPLVLLRRAEANPAARRLYDYLGGGAAAAAFRKAGFTVLSP